MSKSGRRRARCLAAVFAGVLALAGCSSTIEGTPVAQSAASLQNATEIPNDRILPDPTLPPEVAPGEVDAIDVAPGDCVRLGGTSDDATIENAECGSPLSNYVVASEVPTTDLCAVDVDQTYYETSFGVEQGALCLNIDFVVGGCMDLGTPDPERVDCGTAAIDGIEVVDIIDGTADPEECPSSYGRVYDEQLFVVCFEEF